MRRDVRTTSSTRRHRRGAAHKPPQRAAERRHQPTAAAAARPRRRDGVVVVVVVVVVWRLSETDLTDDTDQEIVDFVVEQRRDLDELAVTLRRCTHTFYTHAR